MRSAVCRIGLGTHNELAFTGRDGQKFDACIPCCRADDFAKSNDFQKLTEVERTNFWSLIRTQCQGAR
jgi:hypothetical protein